MVCAIKLKNYIFPACAKLYAYWIVTNYREAYKMYACNGILFNHESPRRGENFVTRKITRSVAKIAIGSLDCIQLGNLDSKRDWGHAKDYVEVKYLFLIFFIVIYICVIKCILFKAMWLMLQQNEPQDFVIATGEMHSIREFVEKAFKHIGKTIIWEGKGLNEVGKEESTDIVRVKVNAKYFRPTEVVSILFS